MTLSRDLRGAARRLAYATALISGNEIPTRYWNDYFNLEPTTFVEDGKTCILPSGKTSSCLGRTNLWGYSTGNIITNDLLEPHIEWLVEQLKLPRDGFREIIEENKLRFRIFCYWTNFSGDRVPFVGKAIEDIIAVSGGVIVIDEYPQPVYLTTDDK